ncbi:hypothetical protein [Trinickia sp.]
MMSYIVASKADSAAQHARRVGFPRLARSAASFDQVERTLARDLT